MAYMTVRLTAGSYDPATNSTSVSATVYMTWDTSQSYDQTNSVGTLTIGDYSTTFSANYNASKTSSGTQVLGGGTTTIKHNSTGDAVQVVADATTPRYSASDIITLPGGTPSGSSGGNTGGSSGGDSGSGSSGSGGSSDLGSEDNPIGGNTGARSRLDSRLKIGNSHYYGDDIVHLQFEAVTSSGLVPFDLDGFRQHVYIARDSTVRVHATVAEGYEIISAILDNPTMEDVPLDGLIDTGHDEFVIHQYAEIVIEAQEITNCNVRMSVGEHTGLVVRRNDTDAIVSDGETVPAGTRVALFFHADIGYDLTVTINGVPIDISYGNWVFIANTHIAIATSAKEYVPPVNIDNESSFDQYEIHIDNGSGFDKYASYIDNGTGWDLYS